MDNKKISKFIELAGGKAATNLTAGSPKQRELGAQLLLSEVLEYIVHGLGVTPSFNGTAISDPNGLQYSATATPDSLAMIDGLADTAYTMFWNSVTFGVPLERAFELVCDNNLEKFVLLSGDFKEGLLPPDRWHCDRSVSWPSEVTTVTVVRIGSEVYAVGKDASGKVRKPSTYLSVDLTPLVGNW
jgi:hypothetical protein